MSDPDRTAALTMMMRLKSQFDALYNVRKEEYEDAVANKRAMDKAYHMLLATMDTDEVEAVVREIEAKNAEGGAVVSTNRELAEWAVKRYAGLVSPRVVPEATWLVEFVENALYEATRRENKRAVDAINTVLRGLE